MKYSLFFFLFLTVNLSQAQDTLNVHFPISMHDFGKIPEDGGLVSYTFVFVNNGSAPILLEEAKPSCGCTVPSWENEAIQPLDTGHVEISFNPTNRPGGFLKSIALKFAEADSTYELYVKGRVVPGNTPIGNNYDVAMGDLLLNNRTLNMGNVYNHDTTIRLFDIFNNGDTLLVFKDSVDHPSHIKVKVLPSEIPAKKSGKLEIAFTPTGNDMLGFQRDIIRLRTNEPADSIKELYITAGIIPYFPPVAEEDTALVPQLSFHSKSHDFKKIGDQAVVSHAFEFQNNGQNPLEIYKVASNCNCIVVEDILLPTTDELTGKIRLSLNPAGRKGSQTSFITVFSNDPVNPVQTLTVKAHVSPEN